MKRFTTTPIALALGVTLTGCGLLGRTVPDGFYGEPNTGTKIRPTDPNGRIQYHKPYWTIEEDGTMVKTAPSGRRLPNEAGKVITQD